MRNKMKSASVFCGNTVNRAVIGLLMAALMVVGIGMKGVAEAASTDTITLTVTPSVNYSVVLTSVAIDRGYEFGTLALSAVTKSDARVLVQNNGNVNSKWQVSAYPDGATVWTLGNTTGTQNGAILKALFNAGGGVAPGYNDFNTSGGSTITATGKVALINGLSTNSTVNVSSPTDQRDLWFMLHTPNQTSAGSQQTFRVYVTAVP